MAHPLIDRWSWAAVDTRIANPELDLARFAADMRVTEAVARRFVEVRRVVLDGRSTLPDLALDRLIRAGIAGDDVYLYLQVADRIEYVLPTGHDVAGLPRLTEDLPPAPDVPFITGPLFCCADDERWSS